MATKKPANPAGTLGQRNKPRRITLTLVGTKSVKVVPSKTSANPNDFIAFNSPGGRLMRIVFGPAGSPFGSNLTLTEVSAVHKCVNEGEFTFECQLETNGTFVTYPFVGDGGDLKVGKSG